jgi:long-chain acyl-CoA synthetase
MRSSLATFLDDYRRHGDAAAIVVHRGNRRLISSWNQIADLADRFASELIRREIPLGERVVIWGQNGLEWMAAFFGCIQRGVIAVPLDPAGALDFANRVIDNTRPRLVIGDANLLRELTPDLPKLSFEDFATTLPQASQTNLRDPALTLDTPFQILFTSGTTAEPKGIVHTHRNVLASLDPIEIEMKKYLKYERIFHPLHFLHTLPLSHVFGQFMGLWIPPLLGAEVHFESRLQAQRLIETIRREQIAVISCVPRVLDLLRSHLLAVDPKLADRIQQAAGIKLWNRWWRFRKIHALFGYRFWAFVCGGAALSPELEGFWASMAFLLVQGYGMTETSAIITLNHPFKTHQGTIGQTLPGREVRITDEGEILVRGDVVSRATWQHGALQQNESEWLATGDLAKRDEEGQLHFVGRKSQVIVTPSGVNVHPEDVEAALNAQSGVQASAVVPLLTTAGTEPAAVLLFRGSEDQAHQAIIAANRQLAEYQQIHQWRLWPELDLPRTSTGKVRRPKVTEWVNAQHPQSSNGDATDPLLALVLSITHANPGNASDDARLSEDLGLDSLGRVQLQSELEQRLGLILDDVAVERVDTLGDLRRELGLHISETEPADAAPKPADTQSPAAPAVPIPTTSTRAGPGGGPSACSAARTSRSPTSSSSGFSATRASSVLRACAPTAPCSSSPTTSPPTTQRSSSTHFPVPCAAVSLLLWPATCSVIFATCATLDRKAVPCRASSISWGRPRGSSSPRSTTSSLCRAAPAFAAHSSMPARHWTAAITSWFFLKAPAPTPACSPSAPASDCWSASRTRPSSPSHSLALANSSSSARDGSVPASSRSASANPFSSPQTTRRNRSLPASTKR